MTWQARGAPWQCWRGWDGCGSGREGTRTGCGPAGRRPAATGSWQTEKPCFFAVVLFDSAPSFPAMAAFYTWAIPACRKPEFIIFKLTFRGMKMPVSHFDWTKPSQKSLSRNEWFHVPLVRLYHIFFKLAKPPVYNNGSNDLVWLPCSNGRTIPFKWGKNKINNTKGKNAIYCFRNLEVKRSISAPVLSTKVWSWSE